MATTLYDERCQAMHLLRSGSTPRQAATEVGRSLAWVYKWQQRYRQGGWANLQDQSRAPQHPAQRIPERVKAQIRRVRSELEAEAQQPGKLNYIGAGAIRSRLRQYHVHPLPSLSTIERELRAAGMVHPRRAQPAPEVDYPHMRPTQPHQLVQVDIVPHYLPGGPLVACFNALDVVSRYPTGQPSLAKHSEDAARFLLHVWHDQGIPEYTQLDNEACFSGGFTHPYVLGRVLRLGLWVGTQLIYSPIRHPESNGFVERFHQDYTQHVWDKLELPDFEALQTQSPAFFDAYRHSHHHSALNGQSPAEVHQTVPAHDLPETLPIPSRLPLTVGKVHFIRLVETSRAIRVLNVDWAVPLAQPTQGVWVTLDVGLQRATLAVFDAAPGCAQRHCLALHPFPLTEPVVPLQACFQRSLPRSPFLTNLATRSFQWLSSML